MHLATRQLHTQITIKIPLKSTKTVHQNCRNLETSPKKSNSLKRSMLFLTSGGTDWVGTSFTEPMATRQTTVTSSCTPKYSEWQSLGIYRESSTLGQPMMSLGYGSPGCRGLANLRINFDGSQ